MSIGISFFTNFDLNGLGANLDHTGEHYEVHFRDTKKILSKISQLVDEGAALV